MHFCSGFLLLTIRVGRSVRFFSARFIAKNASHMVMVFYFRLLVFGFSLNQDPDDFFLFSKKSKLFDFLI